MHGQGLQRGGVKRFSKIWRAAWLANHGYDGAVIFFCKDDAMTHSAKIASGAVAPVATLATLTFAIGACSLGVILVASSAKGICAIFIGDDAGLLVQKLQHGFPNALLCAAPEALKDALDHVIRLVEAPEQRLSLRLDVGGTEFQQRVWQALMTIPAGRTVSYAELAQMVGMPKGARAVAGACAANMLAIAIPCHRVVRNDGALSGYRWGVARKQALLDREAGR